MSLLATTMTTLSPLGLTTATNELKGGAGRGASYVLLTYLGDEFSGYADDKPTTLTEEVRVSLYIKGNFTAIKDRAQQLLIAAGLTITASRFIEYEESSGYNHYEIDVTGQQQEV